MVITVELTNVNEVISQQKVEDVICLLFNDYNKIREERNDLKLELLIKRETEFKNLENSQPIRIAKNKIICLEENTNSVTKRPFDMEVSST